MITEDGIRAALHECAEELRELAIHKRVVKRLCRPNYSELGAPGILAGRYIEAVKRDFTDRIAGLSHDAEQLSDVAKEIRHESTWFGKQRSWI